MSDWNEKHETKRADELQAFFDQLASLLSMPADASPEAVVSEVSRIMSVYRRFTDSNIYAWQARAAKVLDKVLARRYVDQPIFEEVTALLAELPTQSGGKGS